MGSTMASYLPTIALVSTVALSASLTSINRVLAMEQPSHQSIFASIFCIEAAIIYALYMIISRMLSFFLSYIETSSSSLQRASERSGYIASYYYDEIEEDEELMIQSNKNHHHHNDNDSLALQNTQGCNLKGQDSKTLFLLRHYHESPLFFSNRPGFNNGHREALISSMYLGGSGAFLALPALCFWDFSISASFLLSLSLVAFFSDHTKHKEFTPNQDKERVLTVMQRFRWLLYGTLFAVILGIACLDAYDSSYYYYYYYYYYSQANTNPNLRTPGLAMVKNNSTASMGQTVYLSERPWPMMLLSFSSPMLMRMGTINPRTIAHKIIMSPSQSLEAGLPISNLLAILVLCWYSPLDSVLLKTSTALEMHTFVPMLVLCPSCLAAVLAFILRGFHNKQTLCTAVPLTMACVVVQQIMDRKMRGRGDFALVLGMVLVLVVSLSFFFYRLRVLADYYPPTMMASRTCRKVEADPEIEALQPRQAVETDLQEHDVFSTGNYDDIEDSMEEALTPA